MRRFQYLGRAKTFRDSETGALVSDLDSIHRADATEGVDGDFGYDDFDEFGDDDSDEDWSDDDDSDEDSDEDFGDEEEVGATRGSTRRRARRQGRRSKRQARRQGRRSKRRGSGEKVPVQKTALAGSATSASAGAVSITITPAHRFKARDIVSVLNTSSFIRGLIEGAQATPGVPIVINGTIAVGGDVLKATLFGIKPGRPC